MWTLNYAQFPQYDINNLQSEHISTHTEPQSDVSGLNSALTGPVFILVLYRIFLASLVVVNKYTTYLLDLLVSIWYSK